MHENDAADVILNAGGLHYTLKKLKSSTSHNPTPEERELVEKTLDRLKTHDEELITTLASYAVKWDDEDLWTKILDIRVKYAPDVKGEEVEGWKKFRFENVCDL
jgi:hypothetical protein